MTKDRYKFLITSVESAFDEFLSDMDSKELIKWYATLEYLRDISMEFLADYYMNAINEGGDSK